MRFPRLKVYALLLTAALIPACGGGGHGGGGGDGPPPYPNQSATDVRLDTDSFGAAVSTNPRICRAGSDVYAVWEDARSGQKDIRFQHSIDGGATWLPADVRLDTDVAGAAASTNPEIACHLQNVFVVWSDIRSGTTDIYFQKSADGGLTWLANDVRIDHAPGATYAVTPQIITGSATDIYVVWEDGRNGANGDIYFNQSADGGATWLPADVRLDTNGANTASARPRIATSPTEIVVVWQDLRNGNQDIYVNRSLNGGTTWLVADIRLDTAGTADSTNAELCVDGLGHVYVVWQDLRNGLADIYINVSATSGTTWLVADIRLDESSPAGIALSENPSIACFGTGVYVAWGDVRNGPGHDIYYNHSETSGVTWQGFDKKIDAFAYGIGDRNYVKLVADGGFVFAVWQDARLTKFDIYCAYSDDGGKKFSSFDYRFDTDLADSADSLYPQIAASGNTFCVVWQDHRSGNPDIYCNKANPVP